MLFSWMRNKRMDKSTHRSEETNSSKLAHLEKLFLIAQFFSRDVDQAALLVDRVYRSSNTQSTLPEESLRELVLRLVSLSGADANNSANDIAQSIVPGTGPESDVHADHAKRYEAIRFLADRIRLDFLLLPADQMLELWRCVETLSDQAMPPANDALDRIGDGIRAALSADEQLVFGSFITRTAVAEALQNYWNETFIPVPPTLRSVVESGERRMAPDAARGSRSRSETRPKRRQGSRFNRLILYAWVIIAASGIGYLLTRAGQSPPASTDILELSLEIADELDITFRTNSAEQAELFIRDRFAWRLSIPEISDATLIGVSLAEILDAVEVPVLVFSNDEDESLIPVFAFSYGFLENHHDQFGLSRGTLRHIQETAQFDIHELEEKTAVVWRDRDDIFAAFVTGNGSDFQSRVVVRS